MKNVFIILVLSAVLIGTAWAGGGQETQSGGTEEAQTEEAQKEAKQMIAMATDVGGLGDKSFNDGAFEGLKKGLKYGFEPIVVESKQQTDYIPNLTGLAEDGAKIVFAVGFLMEQAVKEAAANNPDTYFAGIDIFAAPGDPANFQGILYREQESGYLAGIVAGMMTTEYSDTSSKLNPDPVVGVLLGMFIPPVERFEVGFIQGVKDVNPSIKVLSVTAGAFDDLAKGKEAALAMMEQGVDIIFQAAGQTGLGAIQAAKEAGILAIGVDVDQNYVAPDTVLTSAVKNIPESVEIVIKSVVDGNFVGGTQVYGLDRNATGLAPFHGFDSIVPQALKDKLEEVRKGIISGEISIAETRADIPDLID